jgi:hypothetical protein
MSADKFEIRESGTPLDHGVLNTPLKKRGDTLFGETRAQFEKRVAAEEKASRVERLQARERAKRAVANLSDERVLAFAAKLGVKTLAQARKKLNSEAHWNPSAILRVFGEAA